MSTIFTFFININVHLNYSLPLDAQKKELYKKNSNDCMHAIVMYLYSVLGHHHIQLFLHKTTSIMLINTV